MKTPKMAFSTHSIIAARLLLVAFSTHSIIAARLLLASQQLK
jgi:hypothetical protein